MVAARTVLIAEDDAAFAEFLTIAFRAMGHEVLLATDGQAAVELARGESPHLVLVDALLPKLDGFQAARAIREALPDVPLLLMSGIYKKRSYEQEAERMGARGYLYKPLSVLDLWELAETHLGGTAAAPGEQPLAGASLEERPLAVLAAETYREKKTGLLFVRGESESAVLFAEEGRIIFGRSNDGGTRLDRVLEDMGLLAADSRARVRQLLDRARGRARLGDLLVQEGLLSPEDVQRALEQQQRMHVTRPFTWRRGAAQYFDCQSPSGETFKLETDMEGLILWAFRHVGDGPGLEAALPGPRDLVSLRRDLAPDAARLGLSPEEVAVLGLLDGTRPTRQVRATGRLAQVDADRLLAGVVALDLAEVRPARERSGPAAEDAEAPSAGELTRVPPDQLLIACARARRTGVLTLEDQHDGATAVRRVHFEEGRVLFASSDDPADRLGRVLLDEGLLSREELGAVMEEVRQAPQVALGRLLVGSGRLSLDQLHEVLVRQVTRIVGRLLSWTSGTFYFSSSPADARTVVPLDLDPMTLVLDGLRRLPAEVVEPRLEGRARLQKSWHCFELATELDLTPLERALLSEVDRFPNLTDLVGTLDAPPEDVRRTAHALLTLGLLEPGQVEPARDAGAETSRPTREEAHPVPLFDDGFGSEEFGAEEPVGPPPDGALPTLDPEPPPEAWSGGDESFDDEGFEEEEPAPSEGTAAPQPTPPPHVPDPDTDSWAGLMDDFDERAKAREEVAGPPARGVASASQALLVEDLGGDPQPEPGIDGPSPASPRFDPPLAEPEPAALAPAGAGVSPGLEVLAPEARAGAPRVPSGDACRPGADVAAGSATAVAIDDLEEQLSRLAEDLSDPSISVVDLGDPATEFALLDFMARLSDHLDRHPGSVPAHVLEALPEHLRRRFGL